MKAQCIRYKDGKKLSQVKGNIIYENDFYYTATLLDKYGNPTYNESFNKVYIHTNELRVVPIN